MAQTLQKFKGLATDIVCSLYVGNLIVVVYGNILRI